MKFFKVLGAVLLVCIALFFIVGLFLPETGTFENSYTIDAPADMVENEIYALYDNHLWPIWNTEDTSVVFTNLPGEIGYTWKGNLVGEGKCEVTEGVNLSIQDHISYQGHDMGETLWQLIPGEKTTVNITFKVFAGGNIGARWTNLFLNSLMGDEINYVIVEMKKTLQNEEL
jgi:hypothetical protein